MIGDNGVMFFHSVEELDDCSILKGFSRVKALSMSDEYYDVDVRYGGPCPVVAFFNVVDRKVWLSRLSVEDFDELCSHMRRLTQCNLNFSDLKTSFDGRKAGYFGR